MNLSFARAALLSAAVGLAACGGEAASSVQPSETGADGGDRRDSSEGRSIDGSLPDLYVDASPPPPLPDFCDGGLFVEVSDDAGSRRLTGSCVDAGPPVPTIASYQPGEDCVGQELRACESLGSVRLFTGCNDCISGSCSMRVTYDDGEGGVYGIEGDAGSPLRWGNADVVLSSRPPDGGIVRGTYTATFTGIADEAGVVPNKTFMGRFCVLSF